MSSDSEYLEMWDKVQDMFPKAQFSICFDPDTLASTLSTENTIFLVIKHKCYCFGRENVPNTYVQVNKTTTANGITYADAVQALIDAKYEPCAHYFLEHIHQVENTIQFEIRWGS